MFPIAIVAGVIGAAVSTAQGASWLQDHIGSSGDASSVGGGKSDAKSQATSAGTSPSFAAALAAQVAGQSVPASTASTATANSVASATVPQATSYDTLERTKAAVAAYSHHAEHQGGKSSGDSAVTQSL